MGSSSTSSELGKLVSGSESESRSESHSELGFRSTETTSRTTSTKHISCQFGQNLQPAHSASESKLLHQRLVHRQRPRDTAQLECSIDGGETDSDSDRTDDGDSDHIDVIAAAGFVQSQPKPWEIPLLKGTVYNDFKDLATVLEEYEGRSRYRFRRTKMQADCVRRYYRGRCRKGKTTGDDYKVMLIARMKKKTNVLTEVGPDNADCQHVQN